MVESITWLTPNVGAYLDLDACIANFLLCPKVYIIWSILFIVFCILMIVTAFITIALTYFQLAVEDHRWWWRSFLCGGSTGLFIFSYCFYFYHQRSLMSGLMQTSFFFGYMGMVCYAVFLMLGSIGFRASLMFVQHIYKYA